jgi:branched-chain amino acid transport system permease protein/neutral amino acid transport system permease protein
VDLLQAVLYGLILSSIFALGAVGISLIFGILRFAHFAHGDMVTLGAYVALAVVTLGGVSVWLALPAAVVATALVAIGLDHVVYRPLRRTRPVILFLASVGVAFILRNLVLGIWGPQNLVYEPGIKLPLQFAGLRLKLDQIVIIVSTVVLISGLALFLKATKIGKAMRAMSDDPDLARVTGIDTDAVVRWTWIIGGAFAATAGVFHGLDTRLQPTLGWDVLLGFFAAAILGGIGRPMGAIAGALVIGLASELSTLFLPPVYRSAVAFVFMVVVLVVRPTGIFAEARR